MCSDDSSQTIHFPKPLETQREKTSTKISCKEGKGDKILPGTTQSTTEEKRWFQNWILQHFYLIQGNLNHPHGNRYVISISSFCPPFEEMSLMNSLSTCDRSLIFLLIYRYLFIQTQSQNQNSRSESSEPWTKTGKSSTTVSWIVSFFTHKININAHKLKHREKKK